jgi:hypothetical protein
MHMPSACTFPTCSRADFGGRVSSQLHECVSMTAFEHLAANIYCIVEYQHVMDKQSMVRYPHSICRRNKDHQAQAQRYMCVPVNILYMRDEGEARVPTHRPYVLHTVDHPSGECDTASGLRSQMPQRAASK